MEKYNMILNELKGMKEFKKIDVDYESLMDSILITFLSTLLLKSSDLFNSFNAFLVNFFI